MFRINQGLMAAIAAGSIVLGCGADGGETGGAEVIDRNDPTAGVEIAGRAEVAGQLLAEIRLTATHRVEFWEIEPGFVAVLEQFNVDHDRPLKLASLKAEKIKLADIYGEALGSSQVDVPGFDRLQAADQRLSTSVRRQPARPGPGSSQVAPGTPNEPSVDTTLVPKSPNCSADAAWFTGVINGATIGGNFKQRNDCQRGTLATPGDFWFSRFQGFGFNQNEIFDPFRVVTLQIQQRVCKFSFGICFDFEWKDLAKIPLATRTANNAWFFVSSGSFEARTRISGEGGAQPPGAVWSQESNGWP